MSSADPPPLPRIVVLLIDDQPMIGEVVRRQLLDQPDLEYHFCQDPTQAVAVANELRPHVILQDLTMPEIDGVELARRFRANPATARTPLILLSSSDDGFMQHQASEAGIDAFLVKLPSKSDLVASIRAQVSSPRQR